MPQIPILFGAYERTGFPSSVAVNCLIERAPTKPSQPEALIVRPGLENFKQVAGAPVRGLFQKAGLFDDAALIVASSSVQTLTGSGILTTLPASIGGAGLVDIDGGLDADLNSIARIAAGEDGLFKVQGGTVTQENFPDSGNAGCSSICFHKGYWLGQEFGTDSFYYQNPAETTWNALQFASAEYQPDRGVALRSVGDVVAMLQTDSFEVWRATGDASSPFEPYGGLTFDHGCIARGTAVNCQGTLIYVDNNFVVRRFSGGDSVPISDNGLTEQISRVDPGDLRASYFVKDGHRCYVLTLGTEATWIFDFDAGPAGKWTKAKSQGQDYWQAQLFANIGARTLAAGSTDQVWVLDANRGTDASDAITMEFMALLEVLEGNVSIANLELQCEVGGAPRSGQGAEPLIWMQVSYDGGKTWSQKRYRSLGATGAYSTKVRWNALGMARAPFGAIFKFGVSDPVIRRVSGVAYNVP